MHPFRLPGRTRAHRPARPRTIIVVASRAVEADIAFDVDGTTYAIRTWSDMSALLAIRLIARHDRPRRGCEAGQCGSCESKVDGVVTRLCQLNSLALDGVSVTTGPLPLRVP